MREIYICLLTVLTGLVMTACRNNDEPFIPSTGEKEISVYMQMKVPGIGKRVSRAVNEEAVSTIFVLVLEDSGEGYRYNYGVAGYGLSVGTAPYDYRFYARLTPTTNPLKFYLLANTGTVTNVLTPGMTEEQIRLALTGVYAEAGFDTTLPMFGELELTGGLTENADLPVVLVRSAARVDVRNRAANFTLTSVQLYRASDRYQIIPDNMISNVVNSPSIPSGTTQSIDTEPVSVTGNISEEQIYLPESPVTPPENRQTGATVVVVGGLYGTDTTPTYYRMDFVTDEGQALLGQVLRNHRYFFDITTVLAAGWRTPDEAAIYPSSQIEAEIKEWNEETMEMVFDNYNYFGVSTRSVRVSYRQGATETIAVDTNLDTYTAYWSDAAGTIDEEAGSITLNGMFEDPDEIFRVAISGDGTAVTVTALRQYDPSLDLPKYIKIIAGRMELLITLTQGAPVYRGDTAINLYGPATGELGSLGNYVLGPNADPNARTIAYVRMLRNSAYFGPGGFVNIEGINISGLASTTTTYPATLISLFDVLYCPYPYNPDPVNILAWHRAASNRVLIVHYDNLGTNTDLMAALGVAYTYPAPASPIQPFTLSPDAPAFITNGVFGLVNNTLQYRVLDNAFGRISPEVAAAGNITPVLLTPDGEGIVLGVDELNGIVYCGDLDLYNFSNSGNPGITIPQTGELNNQAAILLANLWAWIINYVLIE